MGRLAALGTIGRAETHVRRPSRSWRCARPDPVRSMSWLDASPASREDQPVRHGGARRVSAGGGAVRRRIEATRSRDSRPDHDQHDVASFRRSRTCFSTSSIASSGRRGRRRESASGAVAVKETAADSARPPQPAHPAVHSVLLPVPLRLRAQLRHPARAAGRGRPGSQSEESRALVAAFVRSTYFDQRRHDRAAGRTWTRCSNRGAARALLVIPSDFSRSTCAGDRRPKCRCVLDGENANTATTVLGYTNAVFAEASQRLGGTRAAAASSASAPRIWYNPELRSTLFLVPGSDCVPRHDHRRRLDRALHREREGERHDGADPDGADLHARVRPGQDAAVPAAVAGLRVCSSSWPPWRCSGCRCGATGCRYSWSWRCS